MGRQCKMKTGIGNFKTLLLTLLNFTGFLRNSLIYMLPTISPYKLYIFGYEHDLCDYFITCKINGNAESFNLCVHLYEAVEFNITVSY